MEELRESLALAERQRLALHKELEQIKREREQLRADSGLEPSGSGQPDTGLMASAAEEMPGGGFLETGQGVSRAGGPLTTGDIELPELAPQGTAGVFEPPLPTLRQGMAEAPEPSDLEAEGEVSMLSSADDLYAEAFSNFQKSGYHKAILQFNVFVERFPKHDLTDNAFYWMGECWYGLRNYPRAITAYDTVLERFPKGNKAPDSLLKKAYSLQRSGKPREALAALQELIQRYPRSSSATKAQTKVKELEESQS